MPCNHTDCQIKAHCSCLYPVSGPLCSTYHKETLTKLSNSPIETLLCDIKRLLLNYDTPPRELRAIAVNDINLALSQLQK